jgi:hypothetical protein
MLVCAGKAAEISSLAFPGTRNEEGHRGLLRLCWRGAQAHKARRQRRAESNEHHFYLPALAKARCPAIGRAQHRRQNSIPPFTRG